MSVNAVFDQYLEIALYEATCKGTVRHIFHDCHEEDCDEPLEDFGYDTDSVCPETKRSMESDVETFIEHCEETYLNAFDRLNAWEIAELFWRNRNSERDFYMFAKTGKRGEWLAEQARLFGPCELYVGEDELIHVRPVPVVA